MPEDNSSDPQPYEGDGPYVFVCYSHTDKEVPDQIRWLQEQGINIWCDTGIAPGSVWTDALARKIRECNSFLFFVSRSSAESEHCQRELIFAQDEGKQVVAVQLESFELPDGLRLSLGNRQIIHKSEVDESRYQSQLSFALRQGSDSLWSQSGHPDGRRSPADTQKPSVAVLPFDNMSSDREQEYFVDGMAAEIISRLSMNSGLSVIARHSTFYYKGRQVAIRQIREELGVRYIVEGSVRRAGSTVRIAVQMTDATTNTHIWSATYDRELKGVFALQDEIALKISAALNAKYQDAEYQRVRRIPTDHLSAYEFWLQGMGYWFQGTKEAVREARTAFDKAIALDPDYADAYALLGRTYWLEYLLQWELDPNHIENAYELGKKAAILDDSSLDAQMTLACYYQAKGQHEKWTTALERAEALSPNDADIYSYRGWGLLLEGQYEEAIREMKMAIHLNPHPPDFYLMNLGVVYREVGLYGEAVKAQEESLSINPNIHMSHIELCILYIELGREEEARSEAAEVLRLSPSFTVDAYGERFLPYFKEGRVERDMAALRKAGLR